jgi:hypothetical protein
MVKTFEEPLIKASFLPKRSPSKVGDQADARTGMRELKKSAFQNGCV